MPFSNATAETLVRAGSNVDISNSKFLPETLERLVLLAVESGAHVTINAEGMLPDTMGQLARLGKSHVTFRI